MTNINTNFKAKDFDKAYRFLKSELKNNEEWYDTNCLMVMQLTVRIMEERRCIAIFDGIRENLTEEFKKEKHLYV